MVDSTILGLGFADRPAFDLGLTDCAVSDLGLVGVAAVGLGLASSRRDSILVGHLVNTVFFSVGPRTIGLFIRMSVGLSVDVPIGLLGGGSGPVDERADAVDNRTGGTGYSLGGRGDSVADSIRSLGNDGGGGPMELKRLKDGESVLEVVGDDVDEVRVVHDVLDELTRSRSFLVQASPLHAEFESLISANTLYQNVPQNSPPAKSLETHFQAMNETASTMVGCWGKVYSINCKIPTAFENAASHLNDLLAREHTPSDGIGALAMGVGPQITLSVDGIVGDPRILFNPFDEFVQQGRRYEELEVCLQRGAIWRSQPRLVSFRPKLPGHPLLTF